jgi:hypothetical protein
MTRSGLFAFPIAVAETRKADDHAATLLGLAAQGILARLVPGRGRLGSKDPA